MQILTHKFGPWASACRPVKLETGLLSEGKGWPSHMYTAQHGNRSIHLFSHVELSSSADTCWQSYISENAWCSRAGGKWGVFMKGFEFLVLLFTSRSCNKILKKKWQVSWILLQKWCSSLRCFYNITRTISGSHPGHFYWFWNIPIVWADTVVRVTSSSSSHSGFLEWRLL